MRIPILFIVGLVGACGSPTGSLPADPDALAPPPSGRGFQLKTEDVVVPAGTEEQDCYFFRVSDLAAAGGLPADQPVEIHQVQIVMRAGSHHTNLFRVRTITGLDPANGMVQRSSGGTGPCFKSSNWADWPLVANSQAAGASDWTYPDGVANELQPTEMLMLQTHYVNATTQQTPLGAGKVAANFLTLPKEQVTAQLGTLFSTNQSIRVCQSNPTPTFTHACQFKGTGPVHIVGANGHFHSRGASFDIYGWDGMSTAQPDAGARFYHDTDWAEPPMMHSPELDHAIPAGGGVWYSCSYDWQPPQAGCQALNDFDQAKHGTPMNQQDCCYTFGPSVDLNEHCNAFVYYYPKVDDVNCF